MSLILLLDESAICRELLAKVLEGQGFSVSCARTVAEALRVLEGTTPQLMIIDPAVGGQGIQLLETVRRSPRWKDIPIIAVTDVQDKACIMRAAQLGIRDYVLKKRFSLAELLIRVQKHVRPTGSESTTRTAMSVLSASATADRPPPDPRSTPLPSERPHLPAPQTTSAGLRLTREQTVLRLEKSSQAKTLPGVVAEVIALVNSPRGAISDVAQAVKRDPVLSARTLQMANSAAFVSQKPRVASIDEAVRNIGVAGVRNMVLSVGIFESFSTGESRENFDVLRLWQHSFAVAAIMERMVPVSDAAPAGAAHLVGLCHELAELTLRQQFAAEFAAAIELAKTSGRTVPEVGATIFGIPYHELATLVLTKLGLPPMITVPLEEFFERGVRKQQVGVGSVLARALRMANVYAHGLMLAPSPAAVVTPITTAEYRGAFGSMPAPRLDNLLLRSESLMMVNMLAEVPASLAGELCQPLIASTGRKIWYTRHQSYSEFDPMAAILQFAGDVTVHDRIPYSATEVAEYNMIVIAAPRHGNQILAQQETGQVLKLMSANPIPILYLSGVQQEGQVAEAAIRLCMLPVSLATLVEFFTPRELSVTAVAA